MGTAAEGALREMRRLEAELARGEPGCRWSQAELAAVVDTAERLARAARFIAASHEEPSFAAGGDAALATRPRLLLVEDDEATRLALAGLLEDDFEVSAAADALDGLAQARRTPMDAIVSDVHMQGVDGISFLRMLRGDPATADVPCLFLSADDRTREKLLAFGLGAADYLTKPCDPVELVARLKRRLAEARQLLAERHLQTTDELTGLPNRRGLRRHLARALASASSLGVAFLDIDHLKQINDTWGHAQGDAAIVALADVLRRCKRADDFAARLGGDEFVMVVANTDAAAFERLLGRVREELQRAPLRCDGRAVPLSTSVGVAWLRPDETPDALLRRADLAHYEQKRSRPARDGSAPTAPARPSEPERPIAR
jgi:diguanylate cyclase (GGDEF)-like protein